MRYLPANSHHIKANEQSRHLLLFLLTNKQSRHQFYQQYLYSGKELRTRSVMQVQWYHVELLLHLSMPNQEQNRKERKLKLEIIHVTFLRNL
jgi:hypothetical protein